MADDDKRDEEKYVISGSIPLDLSDLKPGETRTITISIPFPQDAIDIAEETAEVLDKIAECDPNDWRTMAQIAGATGSDFFDSEFAAQLPDEERKHYEGIREEYISDVSKFVDDVIADNRPYINREQQIQILMDCPILSKEDLDYKRFKK
jgi:hypothetical protein